MDLAKSAGPMTREQLETLTSIERIGATVSLVSLASIFLAFAFFKRFRIIQNDFLVLASVPNFAACLLAITSQDTIIDFDLRCKAQGFTFEWFAQSDVYWMLAMAINFALSIYGHCQPSAFVDYIPVYCVACFLGPMLPVLALISTFGNPRGPVGGVKSLLCLMSDNLSMARLEAHFGTIWIFMHWTIAILLVSAWFKLGDRIRAAIKSMPSGSRTNSLKKIRSSSSPTKHHKGVTFQRTFFTLANDPHRLIAPRVSPNLSPVQDGWGAPLVPSQGRQPSKDSYQFLVANSRLPPAQISVIFKIQMQLLDYITSLERASRDRIESIQMSRAARNLNLVRRSKLESSRVNFGFASLLFALSVLLTWIPASMNRIFTLSHPGQINFTLCAMSIACLSLQGVWNTVIFFATNSRAVRRMVRKSGGPGRRARRRSHNRRACHVYRARNSRDICEGVEERKPHDGVKGRNGLPEVCERARLKVNDPSSPTFNSLKSIADPNGAAVHPYKADFFDDGPDEFFCERMEM